MVGCRGRGALRRGLLGSVSTGLIHHAHCPVAVIHDKVPSMQPVLVGIDGSPASELATAIAFDEASWRGVDLVALHTWTDAEVSDVSSLEWSAQQAAAEEPPGGAHHRLARPLPRRQRRRGWWFGISRPAVFSTSPSRPNWSSSVATAVADSPECCSVRSALPYEAAAAQLENAEFYRYALKYTPPQQKY